MTKGMSSLPYILSMEHFYPNLDSCKCTCHGCGCLRSLGIFNVHMILPKMADSLIKGYTKEKRRRTPKGKIQNNHHIV